MSEGYEEDMDMYEADDASPRMPLPGEVLRRPVSDIEYPEDPVCVAPETRVGDAIQTLADRDIGALPVIEDRKIVGLFAVRDLLVKGLWDGTKLDRPIREFMTPDPITLTPHDTIAFALNRAVIGRYSHIPLVDSAGNLNGILAMRDVIAYGLSFFPEEVLGLSPHSEHNPPERSVDGG